MKSFTKKFILYCCITIILVIIALLIIMYAMGNRILAVPITHTQVPTTNTAYKYSIVNLKDTKDFLANNKITFRFDNKVYYFTYNDLGIYTNFTEKTQECIKTNIIVYNNELSIEYDTLNLYYNLDQLEFIKDSDLKAVNNELLDRLSESNKYSIYDIIINLDTINQTY